MWPFERRISSYSVHIVDHFRHDFFFFSCSIKICVFLLFSNIGYCFRWGGLSRYAELGQYEKKALRLDKLAHRF